MTNAGMVILRIILLLLGVFRTTTNGKPTFFAKLTQAKNGT